MCGQLGRRNRRVAIDGPQRRDDVDSQVGKRVAKLAGRIGDVRAVASVQGGHGRRRFNVTVEGGTDAADLLEGVGEKLGESGAVGRGVVEARPEGRASAVARASW